MCLIVVGALAPPLFSVFCLSKRPPARHPEAARTPTHPAERTKNAAQQPRGPRLSEHTPCLRLSPGNLEDPRRTPRSCRRAGTHASHHRQILTVLI